MTIHSPDTYIDLRGDGYPMYQVLTRSGSRSAVRWPHG
jgi:hypothetical protein